MGSNTPPVKQEQVEYDPFEGPRVARSVPSTEPQREVFVSAYMGDEANCAYNESISLELEGPLDRARLLHALEQLVQRHEGLRSTMSSDGARTVVFEDLAAPLHFTDLLDDPEQEAKLLDHALQDMGTPFDLLHGPLFRTRLFRTAADRHLLRITGHHVVCDGWSLGTIVHDLGELYSGRTPAPAISLGRYALAVAEAERSPEHAATETFWLQRFAQGVPRVELPTDRPRPNEKTYNGDRIDVELAPDTVRGLKAMAVSQGATLVTTLLAAFEVLLYRITGEKALVVGLPAAGQNDMDMAELVAHCVNLLPLSTRISPDQPFTAYLAQRRSDVLNAYDHQRYTLGTLVRKLNIPREPGRIPLTPVVFNVDMNMDSGTRFDGLRHRLISNPRSYEQFELFLNVTGSEDRLMLEWGYNTDLFDADTVRGWSNDLVAILDRIIVAPGAPLNSVAQRPVNTVHIPDAWIGTVDSGARKGNILDRFAQCVRDHAMRNALVHGQRHITYAELDSLVQATAGELHKAGVAPGDRVGILAEKDPSMIVACLAALRLGACYVPLDMGYPAERIAFMVKDLGLRTVLADPARSGQVPDKSVRVLPIAAVGQAPIALPPCPAGPETPAYIMYTSGSTGTPKGVVVPHRAVVRLVQDQQYLPFGPELVFMLLSNTAFDASTLEIWGALLNGGTLVIPTASTPSLPAIVEDVVQHGVNTLWLTTGLFNVLVDEQPDLLRKLRHILTGGDVLSIPHVRRALSITGPGVIINGYGPTENTTFTTTYAVNTDDAWPNGIPIGRPLHGTTVHILDEDLAPVPIGSTGELYTGGAGVALGYWERKDQDAERFIADPFAGQPDAMLYRTGDLVRWGADGNVLFIGRADGQVKVRGFRIETGEVENALNDLPTVKDRVVIAADMGQGEKQLVCYLVPQQAGTEHDTIIAAVRTHLQQRLPEHMVPTAFVVLDAIPLTANGKVDRAALPRTIVHQPSKRDSAPRNGTERTLCSIWKDLLGLEDIGIHDNFFDLGGHSLIGIRMLARVEDRLKVKLPLKTLFSAPTVAELAAALHRTPEDQQWTNLTAVRTTGKAAPLFCVHGDEANHFIPRYLDGEHPFYCFVHQGEDGSPLRYNTVGGIATHFLHELRQARPKGPYLLCGYSFGGLVAYEMACRLQAMGEEVPFLGLFDTYAPSEHAKALRMEGKWYDELKRTTMRAVIRSRFRKGEKLPVRLRHFNIIDTYNQAIASYKPPVFNGTITLFRAQDDRLLHDMGWGAIGPVEVVPVPGDHYTMIKEPAVATLTARMNEQLQHTAQAIRVQ